MTAIAKLQLAQLMYGRTIYPVNDHPAMPQVFDFDNVAECAKLVCACLSNASGGHWLLNCRVGIDYERRTANIVANGAHAYFAPDDLPKMTLDEAIEATQRIKHRSLGSVVTNQYAEGWRAAKWAESPE